MAIPTPNYIEGPNPFHLGGPPDWWLRKLWDFDNTLVVVPSVQGFHYRLAQRRPLDEKVKLVNDISVQGDSLIMKQYGLVPVTTLLATARWDNPLMWNDLAERAPWRQGGADEYERKLDAIERAKNIKIAEQTNDHNTYLSKDAWKMYQIKTGRRIGLGPATKNVASKPQFGQAPLVKIN